MAQYRKRRYKKKKPSNSELTVLPIAPLTAEEESDRLLLERKVERAFYQAGMALMELRDRKLYRSTHATFEEYCRDRFDYTRRRPYQLIEAAQIYHNLIEKCAKILHIFPTKEGQVQPLGKLKTEEQPSAWIAAVKEAKGKVPTGRIVKQVVQKIQDRVVEPKIFEVGEICTIRAKDNLELRGYGGCWCIVSEIYEFSYRINTWDNEFVVHWNNLKSLEFSRGECKEMEDLGIRMTRLHQTGKLDEAALWVLKGLARLKTPYLTILEEKLLNLLEAEYGTKQTD